MEIYIKKNGKLTTLGEGKIYSKSQLRLNEVDSNGDSNTITLTNTGEGTDAKSQPSELANDAKKELNSVNASGKKIQFSVQPNSVAGLTPNMSLTQNSTQAVPTVNVSQNDPRLTTLMQTNAKNGYATNIIKGMQTSSVASRKVLDELRKNAIPFSKKELTSFLKDI